MYVWERVEGPAWYAVLLAHLKFQAGANPEMRGSHIVNPGVVDET
jgi:hypothetical protein